MPVTELNKFLYFKKKKNQLYFFQEFLSPHAGKRGIVSQALSRLDNTESLASIEETKLLFKILDILMSMKKNKHASLVSLISTVAGIFSSLRATSEENCPTEFRLPTTLTDAKAMCTEGRFSIFFNLPSCEVKNIPGHACVSLSEYLDHVLGHGLDVSFLQDSTGVRNTQKINGTPKATEILEQIHSNSLEPDQTVIGCGFMWADRFLGSYIRQNTNLHIQHIKIYIQISHSIVSHQSWKIMSQRGSRILF